MSVRRRNILCRERLQIILRALAHGPVEMRRLQRHQNATLWELDQAEAAGWVRTFFRESQKGMATHMIAATGLCNALPPLRKDIEAPISLRHAEFARRSVREGVRRGMNFAGIHFPPILEIYPRVYPGVRNKCVANAAASRLMKRKDVRAARAWYYAVLSGEVAAGEPMPIWPSKILERLARSRQPVRGKSTIMDRTHGSRDEVRNSSLPVNEAHCI
jgi:hypothetical protein